MTLVHKNLSPIELLKFVIITGTLCFTYKYTLKKNRSLKSVENKYNSWLYRNTIKRFNQFKVSVQEQNSSLLQKFSGTKKTF